MLALVRVPAVGRPQAGDDRPPAPRASRNARGRRGTRPRTPRARGRDHPAPMPSPTRPPLIWSTCATWITSRPGHRNVTLVTRVPRLMVLVSRASAPSVTHASVGPGTPSLPNARKWSERKNAPNPSSSVFCATRRRSSYDAPCWGSVNTRSSMPPWRPACQRLREVSTRWNAAGSRPLGLGRTRASACRRPTRSHRVVTRRPRGPAVLGLTRLPRRRRGPPRLTWCPTSTRRTSSTVGCRSSGAPPRPRPRPPPGTCGCARPADDPASRAVRPTVDSSRVWERRHGTPPAPRGGGRGVASAPRRAAGHKSRSASDRGTIAP